MTKTCSQQIATLAEAQEFFATNQDVDAIDIIFTNMCGVPRGKRLRQHEVLSVYKDGRFLPGSAVVVDITGRDTEETGLVWEDGDADRRIYPIPGSLRLTPWGDAADGTKAAQFLTGFYELDGTPHGLDPRHVLGRVLDRFYAKGIIPDVAVELEFYLLDAKRGRDGRPRPARSPITGGTPNDIQVYGLQEMEDFRAYFDEVYRAARIQGLPLEAGISEYAPGQFEMTLEHKADALAAADDAIMHKRLIKAVAGQHGMTASFMAKPFAEQAGNGMHLHVSLLDANGNNLFASEEPEGTPLLRQAIGGMQAALGDSFLIFAPNANSYRRFKANSYAPVSTNWGVNNRTVSFRVTAGAAKTRHIEHRIGGADANPYLALATMLAGILHGIEGQLDPGAPVVGNGYEQVGDGAALPNNWLAAIDRFEQSALMQASLGEDFVKHYSIVKRTEAARFFAEVPILDYDWYLRTA